MVEFFAHLSWSLLGGIGGGALLFVANILLGRWLGPSEYGKAGLVQAIAQITIIFFTLGLDVTIARALAQPEHQNPTNQTRLTSVSFASIVIATLFFGVSFLTIRSIIARYLGTTPTLVMVSVFYAVLLGLKVYEDGFIRGRRQFRYQAAARVVEALVVVLSLAVAFFGFHIQSYVLSVWSLGVGALVYGSIIFVKLVPQLHWPQQIGSTVRQLARYAQLVTIGSIINLILTYSDRVSINKFLGSHELGIYMAYYTGSITIATQVSAIISNVFFPAIANAQNHQTLISKLDRLSLSLGIPLAVGTTSLTALIMALFGRQYPFSWSIAILFGLWSTAYLLTSFYATVINAHSEQTFAWGLLWLLIRSVLFVVYLYISLKFKFFSISALVIGLTANYIIDIFNMRYIFHRYGNNS